MDTISFPFLQIYLQHVYYIWSSGQVGTIFNSEMGHAIVMSDSLNSCDIKIQKYIFTDDRVLLIFGVHGSPFIVHPSNSTVHSAPPIVRVMASMKMIKKPKLSRFRIHILSRFRINMF